MKIKTKKQMTAEEYAKYMIDKHGIRGYESELIDSNIIGAPKIFSQKFELNPTSKEDLLTGSFRNGEVTVEVEEEITEYTKFRHIVFVDDCDLSASCLDSSINDIKYGKEKEFHAYIDGEFKCIWRDGKLVE